MGGYKYGGIGSGIGGGIGGGADYAYNNNNQEQSIQGA
jgi:hypothetical protein